MQHMPFATPGLAALDSIRIALFLIGFSLVGLYLRSRWSDTRHNVRERARVAGMALALFVLALGRTINIGLPMTWELPASVVVFGLVGFSVLKEDRT